MELCCDQNDTLRIHQKPICKTSFCLSLFLRSFVRFFLFVCLFYLFLYCGIYCFINRRIARFLFIAMNLNESLFSQIVCELYCTYYSTHVYVYHSQIRQYNIILKVTTFSGSFGNLLYDYEMERPKADIFRRKIYKA